MWTSHRLGTHAYCSALLQLPYHEGSLPHAENSWGNLSLFLLSQVILLNLQMFLKIYKMQWAILQVCKLSRKVTKCPSILKTYLISNIEVRIPLTTAMGQLVDPILSYQYSPAAPFNLCCCSFCLSRTPCLSGKEGRKRTDEHRDLSTWAILYLPPAKNFITRLTMSVVPTLRGKFCITSKAKWLRAAAFKEPFHCSFLILPHQRALAPSLKAILGIVQLNSEQLGADPVQAHPPSKCSNKKKHFTLGSSLRPPQGLTHRKQWGCHCSRHSCPRFQVTWNFSWRYQVILWTGRSGCSLWLLLFGKVCLRCGRAASREINPSTQDIKFAVLWAVLWTNHIETCLNMIEPFMLSVV